MRLDRLIEPPRRRVAANRHSAVRAGGDHERCIGIMLG